MNIFAAVGLFFSFLISSEALSSVKPSHVELAKHSTLIVVAQITSISKPYVNQSVVTLKVKDVLRGHQPQLPIVLTILDNSMIVKGSLNFSAIKETGINHIYYLNYSEGEYKLSDSWFGVIPASEDLISKIKNLYMNF
jgi:hypothetical protein